MLIAIGSDHRGIDFKKFVISCLTELGFEGKDFGTFSTDSVDYPDIALKVSKAVVGGECQFGILICGTGIGMSMAANKIKGIRAALCCDEFAAERARLHNDANIICLGAERGENGIKVMLKVFFTTQYEGGRHQRRLDKMSKIEQDIN
jgi:ribose 5-phosphate isomerase B